MSLQYKEITDRNLLFATKIQTQIFPNESAYEHYKWAISQNLDYEKYYLVYEKDRVIGITGIYSNEPLEETNSLWLGWYGILPEFRKKGYGTKILLDTIEIAKELKNKYPIKYFRLYTDQVENKESLSLYEKQMDIKEKYENDQDDNYNGNCLIYSKSLIPNEVPKWNNQFLNLREIIAAEEKGNEQWGESTK